VIVGAASIRASKKQAETAFADAMTKEYRDVASLLPLAAFYVDGQVDLTDDLKRALFRYFDLSNEQMRLINIGRVKGPIAEDWRTGIEEFMCHGVVKRCWLELSRALPDDYFSSLEYHVPAPARDGSLIIRSPRSGVGRLAVGSWAPRLFGFCVLVVSGTLALTMLRQSDN
jgi:hypothetical protein